MDTTSKGILDVLTSNVEGGAYFLSIPTLQNNLSSITKAFKRLYSGVFIGYSFKTNYIKDICEEIKKNGHLAEVVSPTEYDYARTLGFPPTKIIYNGVIPDYGEKFNVAVSGGRVNVDNIEEYRLLSSLAFQNKLPILLGVRVNFDVGNGLVSRFGVDINGQEFLDLMDEISNDPYVTLYGFQTHIGTARQLKYWKKKIDIMIELAKAWGARYIDLGGTLFGPMPEELSSQFDSYVGSFDEYAEVVAGAMAKAFPKGDVDLILEPGTALVGNTMKTAAFVSNIKDVRGQTYITVSCCSNHIGMLCECRDIPCEIIPNPEAYYEKRHVKDAVVVGDTCLEFDYIKKGLTGEIGIGDVLVFDNCGAYSISASRQFIVPRLPVYSLETGELLLKGETSSDMLGRYMKSTEKRNA